jgi:hypothetical protein
MTPLRAKFIRDLVVRGRSKHTQEAYTRYVRDLARYYSCSPELISYEEITDWVYHLITEGSVATLQAWRDRLVRCSFWTLRFAPVQVAPVCTGGHSPGDRLVFALLAFVPQLN